MEPAVLIPQLLALLPELQDQRHATVVVEGRLGRLQPLLVAAFGRVGRRSLDSFFLLSVAVVLLGALAPYQPAGLLGNAWSVAVYVLIWGWAWLRDSGQWARWRNPIAGRTASAPGEPVAVAATSSASS